MRRAGLARQTRLGNATLFESNPGHPGARTLEALLAHEEATHPREADRTLETGKDVRGALAAWGAPLEAGPLRGELPPVEDALVAGAHLSRFDGNVARSLPVCLWKNRNRVDYDRLLKKARRAGERHTVGFFLSMTGTLAGDRSFPSKARRFRDRRVLKEQDFFLSHQSSLTRELARHRTPRVAKAWNFTMNMSLDTFASTFRKFVTDAKVPLR